MADLLVVVLFIRKKRSVTYRFSYAMRHDDVCRVGGGGWGIRLVALVLFFSFGFTPCKAEQLQQGMELKEKESQKG